MLAGMTKVDTSGLEASLDTVTLVPAASLTVKVAPVSVFAAVPVMVTVAPAGADAVSTTAVPGVIFVEGTVTV